MQLNHHLFELDRLWVFRINVHGQIGFRARTIDFIQYYLVEPVPIEGKVEHGLKLGQDVLRSHVSVGRGTGWFARRRGVRLVYCLSVDSSLGDLCSVIVATSDRSVSFPRPRSSHRPPPAPFWSSILNYSPLTDSLSSMPAPLRPSLQIHSRNSLRHPPLHARIRRISSSSSFDVD